MTTGTDLSVVIPHFGDPAPTIAVAAALVSQVRALGGELVIVDDGSPEPLGEVVGATVIRREVNGGFGAAVNSGVALVRTPLVAILNSDLVVTNDFLSSYVAAAIPWLPAVVAPRVVTHGHSGASTFRFPTARIVLAQRFGPLFNQRDRRWASDLVGEDRPRDVTDEHVVDWVSGAAMLMPTDLLREVGGFDERFHMYFEEVDLQRRLRDVGVPAVYVGHVTVEHLGFGSSASTSRERWHEESLLKYADKWGWAGRLRLSLAGASFATLATDGIRKCLGRDVHPVVEWRRRGSLAREVRADHARRA